MSTPSPFAAPGSPTGGFGLPGQRKHEDDDVEVVLLPGLPRVDLMPASVASADSFRRVQVGLAAALGLVVVGAAAATVLAGAQVDRAQGELAAEQARTTTLQQQEAQYADVPLVRAQLDALTTARTAALGDEVLWYRYSAHLSGALPQSMRLTSLQMSSTPAAVDPATGVATVASDTPVGSMTLSLDGSTVPDSAALLDVLDATPGLAGPWADSTTVDPTSGDTTVAAHVDVSSAALSGRWTQPDPTAVPAAAPTVPATSGTTEPVAATTTTDGGR